MDKPFRTYEQLADLMKERGLDPGEHTAMILEREGYYPVVNGYKDLFVESGDRYKEGATLDEVYALFVMDRRLRALLFRYITLAEGLLKSICSYEFCARHQDDNDAYLDLSCYGVTKKNRRMIEKFIDDVNTMLGRNPKKRPAFKKDYLEHYKSAHDNVPLWVVMNSLSLGQAFKFYTFLDESARFAIAQRYQAMFDEMHGKRVIRITHQTIRSSYDHVKDFRNICAHDERLFCARVDKSQSTDFKRLMQDMYAILTPDQCRSLLDGILRCLDFASERIETVSEAEILSRMGFASRSEIERCLTAGTQ